MELTATSLAVESVGEVDAAILEREERRAHMRTKLSLPGRYMLEDGGEYVCETVDVSPCGVLLHAETIAEPGSRVIAYIDEVGRLEGHVVRTVAEGFALALSCTPRKTQRLADKINWLAQNGGDEGKERRRSPRFEREGALASLTTDQGAEHQVELIDISVTGIAFLTDLAWEIGDRIEIGAQKARIVRMFPGGAAAAFL